MTPPRAEHDQRQRHGAVLRRDPGAVHGDLNRTAREILVYIGIGTVVLIVIIVIIILALRR